MAQEFKTQVFNDAQIDTGFKHSSTPENSLQMSLDHHINEGWEVAQFHFNTTHAANGKHNTVLVVYSREKTAKAVTKKTTKAVAA